MRPTSSIIGLAFIGSPRAGGRRSLPLFYRGVLAVASLLLLLTTADARRPVVVFFGDSLTAGFGVDPGQAFPALVGERLAAAGRPVDVVNAGISGDTSAGGVRRIDWVLRQKPDLVVIELGANDGLRGLPVADLERNLQQIVQRAQRAGSRVVLVGMRLPPSLGAPYVREFESVFPRVAREMDVPLIPFLLEGVGGRAELNQPDGIHPTAQGHVIVARTVLPYVDAALRAAERQPRRASDNG